MAKIISGIQQIGIGIPDMHEAWKWYRGAFGMDIRMFEESAEAPDMANYTGGKVQSRIAALAVNMKGGGGFEIWQYTSREPVSPKEPVVLGDYGIFAGKMKAPNVAAAYNYHKANGYNILGELGKTPDGGDTFFVIDPYENIFQVVQSDDWFSTTESVTGGAEGSIIGVSDIDKARTLYSDILGYDKVVYDEDGVFTDFSGLPGGDQTMRRVLLRRQQPTSGSFSEFLGSGSVELVQVQGSQPKKIFADRYWGDRGFIHLCFDIKDMNAMKAECESKGYPFTVDSGEVFDMGEASGRFSYIEDPDGTLIEFVETNKIPIVKKIGWYLTLNKKNPEKPLPRWILKMLSFNRVKD